MRRFTILAAGALGLGLAGAALGLSVQEEPAPNPAQTCITNGTVPWEAVIRACTTQIESRQVRGAALAALYQKRAVANWAGGHRDRAIADDSEAIRLNPAFAEAYIDRGFVYAQMGDDTRALADLNRAVRLAPNNHRALNHRGLVLSHQGNHAAAIRDFDAAIRIAPQFDWPYQGRGAAFEALGNPSRAMADYNAAARLDTSTELQRSRCRLHQAHPELVLDPPIGWCR